MQLEFNLFKSQLPEHEYGHKGRALVRAEWDRILHQAFDVGLKELEDRMGSGDAVKYPHVVIRCTLEQFGLFVALRARVKSIGNDIASMDVRFIQPLNDNRLDVSQHRIIMS